MNNQNGVFLTSGTPELLGDQTFTYLRLLLFFATGITAKKVFTAELTRRNRSAYRYPVGTVQTDTSYFVYFVHIPDGVPTATNFPSCVFGGQLLMRSTCHEVTDELSLVIRTTCQIAKPLVFFSTSEWHFCFLFCTDKPWLLSKHIVVSWYQGLCWVNTVTVWGYDSLELSKEFQQII